MVDSGCFKTKLKIEKRRIDGGKTKIRRGGKTRKINKAVDYCLIYGIN